MRMLGYLKDPYKCNKKDTIYKIVLHKTNREVFVYLYTSLNAVFSSFDRWYQDEESALEVWQSRNTNTPQWGKYEIYQDGEWKDYKP